MAWRTLDGSAPRIIAHRGASGLRPEHTLEGYALALAQGADIVEPDLVVSADGVLFARHDPGLARSTDIRLRPQFAARREQGDWPCDRFDADEIDQLRAIQPNPARSAEFDRRWPPPRWPAVLAWAQQAAQERGEPVLVYPEIKHPALFESRGVDAVQAFIASMAAARTGVEVWVQCFDAPALRRVHEATGLRCSLGVSAGADWRASLRDHGDWLSGLVASKELLHGFGGVDSGLVAAAHADGLRVDAYTFRDDQVGKGHAGIGEELEAAMRAGVDGLFCDFPATAIAVRARLSAG
jgi:glycerophosphoryl diester phosphodiesterase